MKHSIKKIIVWCLLNIILIVMGWYYIFMYYPSTHKVLSEKVKGPFESYTDISTQVLEDTVSWSFVPEKRYLYSLDLILLNVSEESQGYLNYRIKEVDGKEVMQGKLALSEIVPGGWQELPVGEPLDTDREYLVQITIEANAEAPYAIDVGPDFIIPEHETFADTTMRKIVVDYNYGSESANIALVVGGIIFINLLIFAKKDTVSSKKMQKTERILMTAFLVLVCVLFGILTYYSLRYTYYSPDISVEKVIETKDNLFGNLFGLAAMLLVLWLVGKGCSRIPEKKMWILLVAVNVVAVIAGIYWLSCHSFLPRADQRAVCECAIAMENGDFSSLSVCAYVGRCPHQIGIITLLRLMFRIAGTETGMYNCFKGFNVCMMVLMITAGYYIVGHLSKGRKNAQGIYLALMLLCVPMYGYVPYIYGEISSTALVLAAVWAMLSCIKDFRAYKVAVMALTLSLAVLLRTNALICVIAICIVLLIKMFITFDKRNVFMFMAVIFSVFLTQTGLKDMYVSKAGHELAGIPMLAYVSMGLNENDFGPGWYDNSNSLIYTENGGDAAVAQEISVEHIKDRLGYMSENKAYGFAFFKEKFLIQWNAPMYQAFVMNGYDAENAKGLVYELYIEDEEHIADKYMSIYQLYVFVMILALLVKNLICSKKRIVNAEFFTLLIAIFGGALFSIIWEAKSRYIFPYFMFMIPYAAILAGELRLESVFVSFKRISGYHKNKLVK